MSHSRRALLLLLPLVLLLMAFRQVPLHNPPPIAVSAKITHEQEAKAITAALLHRQWVVNANNPNEIDATLHQNEWSVRVADSFNEKTILIRYLDSTNLKYEKKNGVEYIHKNYPLWIQNLVDDIQSNLVLFGS